MSATTLTHPSPSLRAKRSNPSRRRARERWIASSLRSSNESSASTAAPAPHPRRWRRQGLRRRSSGQQLRAPALRLEQRNRLAVEGDERVRAERGALESDHPVGEVASRLMQSKAPFDGRTVDDDIAHLQQTTNCEGDVRARNPITSIENPGKFAKRLEADRDPLGASGNRPSAALNGSSFTAARNRMLVSTVIFIRRRRRPPPRSPQSPGDFIQRSRTPFVLSFRIPCDSRNERFCRSAVISARPSGSRSTWILPPGSTPR